jgi:signal transduction histidine kinase
MEVFAEEYLGQLDDNARAYLQSVNNATKRMSILVNSLLDFSRLGKNRNLAYVDIQNVINDVLEDINSKVRTSNAVIKVAPMPKLYIYESERPIHVSCGPENSRAAYVMIKNASRGRIPRPYALRRHQSADGLAIRLG